MRARARARAQISFQKPPNNFSHHSRKTKRFDYNSLEVSEMPVNCLFILFRVDPQFFKFISEIDVVAQPGTKQCVQMFDLRFECRDAVQRLFELQFEQGTRFAIETFQLSQTGMALTSWSFLG
jgi:hypothetical protein